MKNFIDRDSFPWKGSAGYRIISEDSGYLYLLVYTRHGIVEVSLYRHSDEYGGPDSEGFDTCDMDYTIDGVEYSYLGTGEYGLGTIASIAARFAGGVRPGG